MTPSNVTVQFTHKTSFVDPPQSEIYEIYSTIRRHGEKQAALVFYKDEVSGTPGAAGALSHLWERSATASGGLQVHNIQTKAAAGVREVIHLRLNIQLPVMPVGFRLETFMISRRSIVKQQKSASLQRGHLVRPAL